MKKISFLSVFLVFNNLIVIAQTGLIPVTFTTHTNNSEFTGFIEAGNFQYNPKNFLIYPTDARTNAKNYSPTDIKEIEIKGLGIYKGFIIKKYTHEINAERLSENYNYTEIKETDTIEPLFLQLLVTGKKLTLYAYHERGRSNYYMQEPGKEVVVLRYLRTISGQASIVTEYRYYLQQLKSYTGDDNSLINKLSLLDWKEKEFISFFKLLNKDKEASVSLENTNREYMPQKYFFAGGGLSIMNFKLKGTSPLSAEPKITDFQFPVSIGAALYVGMDIETGKIKKIINIQPMLAIQSFSSRSTLIWSRKIDGVAFTDYYNLNGFSILLGSAFKFVIKEKLRIGGGFHCDFDFYSTATHSTNELSYNTNLPVRREQLHSKSTFSIKGSFIGEMLIGKKNSITLLAIPLQKDFARTTTTSFGDGGICLTYARRFRIK